MFGWFRKRPTPPIVGTWILVEAGGGPPQSIGVESMRLVLRADGSLHWESKMGEPWAGMTLSGDGTWAIKGERVFYTSDDLSSSSVARADDSQLLLDPDFVLRRNGDTRITGLYSRSVDD